jgi:hypothetical protein
LRKLLASCELDESLGLISKEPIGEQDERAVPLSIEARESSVDFVRDGQARDQRLG